MGFEVKGVSLGHGGCKPCGCGLELLAATFATRWRRGQGQHEKKDVQPRGLGGVEGTNVNLVIGLLDPAIPGASPPRHRSYRSQGLPLAASVSLSWSFPEGERE